MTETGGVSVDPEAARAGLINDMQLALGYLDCSLRGSLVSCGFGTSDFPIIEGCFASPIFHVGDVVELLMCV